MDTEYSAGITLLPVSNAEVMGCLHDGLSRQLFNIINPIIAHSLDSNGDRIFWCARMQGEPFECFGYSLTQLKEWLRTTAINSFIEIFKED